MNKVLAYTFLLSIMVAFGSCTGDKPTFLGVKDGKLSYCKPVKNCICSKCPHSMTRIVHFKYAGSREAAYQTLLSTLKEMEGSEIMVTEENYIYSEFTSSFWRFVDDVEFYFPEMEGVIHFRSASRIGYYDYDVNRERIEKVRELAGFQ